MMQLVLRCAERISGISGQSGFAFDEANAREYRNSLLPLWENASAMLAVERDESRAFGLNEV